MHRVQMICMPYQLPAISSLATALLASVLRRDGVPVEESYFHFDFARRVGRDLYSRLTVGDTESGLLAELFFAEDIHGESSNPRLEELFGPFESRRRIREEFRDACLEVCAGSRPTLAAFTTSFNQLLPSLWLARALKQADPRIRTVFGGSACTGEMGMALTRAYPEIDCVVSGNGERALTGLASGGIAFPSSRCLTDEAPVDLNELPVPDYDAYVAEARRAGRTQADLMLSYETSRGCWWGEKHHCTFCGINGAQMRFAAKTTGRAYSEIRGLWEKYGYHLFSTDSILAREHLRDLLPRLAEHADRPILFYEIKANLTPADIALLRNAGISHIQPGIESLSTPVLQSLKKGVRMLQNIALLKWCRERDIRVSWNLLYAVPGEQAGWYREQMELMSRIPHLPPPTSISRIRIDRFSPYHQRPREYGWDSIRPLALYFELHRTVDPALLPEIAYHFDGIGGCIPVGEYERELAAAFELWQQRHRQGDGLFWDQSLGLFEVRDGEVFGYERTDQLDELIASTHEPANIAKLRERAGVPDADWDALVEAGVLVTEGNQVLNTAIRLDIDNLPQRSSEEILFRVLTD